MLQQRLATSQPMSASSRTAGNCPLMGPLPYPCRHCPSAPILPCMSVHNRRLMQAVGQHHASVLKVHLDWMASCQLSEGRKQMADIRPAAIPLTMQNAAVTTCQHSMLHRCVTTRFCRISAVQVLGLDISAGSAGRGPLSTVRR